MTLRRGITQPIYFGQLSDKKFKALNQKLTQSGFRPLQTNALYLHPSVVDKLIQKRIIQDGMTPDQVSDVAFSAIHNSKSKVFSTKAPHVKVLFKPINAKTANSAYVGDFGGQGSIKSVYPKELAKIKNESLGGRGTPPSGAKQLNPAVPVSGIQGSR